MKRPYHQDNIKVHSDDVKGWGLTDGKFVKMASRRREIELKVEATTRSPRGTVLTSLGFADTTSTSSPAPAPATTPSPKPLN